MANYTKVKLLCTRVNLLCSLKGVFVVVWRNFHRTVISGPRGLGVIYWGGGAGGAEVWGG